MTIVLASGISPVTATLAELEQTAAAVEETRAELDQILHRILIRLTESGRDGADCHRDTQETIRMFAEKQFEVTIRDLSSRLNINILTSECAERLRLDADLKHGYGIEAFLLRRTESGPQTTVSDGAGGLIREDRRPIYTVYGYGEPRTLPHLPYEFPTRASGTAEWNIHFLPDELLRRLFGTGPSSRRLDTRRRRGEIHPSQLASLIPGYSEDVLGRRLVGTRTWFWEITVSTAGRRLRVVAARIPGPSTGTSARTSVTPPAHFSPHAPNSAARAAGTERTVGDYLIVEKTYHTYDTTREGKKKAVQ